VIVEKRPAWPWFLAGAAATALAFAAGLGVASLLG